MSLRAQGVALFTAAAALIGALVVVQLWLLSVSIEAYLGHARGVALQAAAASGVLALVNAGLLRYVGWFDRATHGGRKR